MAIFGRKPTDTNAVTRQRQREKGWQRFTGTEVINFDESALTSDPRAHAYLEHLVAEYDTLPYVVNNPGARQVAETIKARFQNSDPTLTWREILVLETALLSLKPTHVLRREAWNLRARYRDIVGQDVIDLYNQSNPPSTTQPSVSSPPSGPILSGSRFPASPPSSPLASPPLIGSPAFSPPAGNQANLSPPIGDEVDDPALRADLKKLQGEIHWFLIFLPLMEKIRNRLATGTLFGILGLLVLAFLVFRFFNPLWDNTNLTTMLTVALFGALGSFISTLARLFSLNKGVRLDNLYELKLSPMSLIQMPLNGAVFALIAYFLFVGGLLQGTIFPQMTLISQSRLSLDLTPNTVIGGSSTVNVNITHFPPLTSGLFVTLKSDHPDLVVFSKDPVTVKPGPPPKQGSPDAPTLSTRPVTNPTQVKITAIDLDEDVAEAILAVNPPAPQPTTPPKPNPGGAGSTQNSNNPNPLKAPEKPAALPTTAGTFGPPPTPPTQSQSSPPFSWKHFKEIGPATMADWAKLLVWAFIAGFAERLIPDRLQSLINKSQTLDQAKPS